MIANEQLSPFQGSPKYPVFPGIRFAHPGLFSIAPPAREWLLLAPFEPLNLETKLHTAKISNNSGM